MSEPNLTRYRGTQGWGQPPEKGPGWGMAPRNPLDKAVHPLDRGCRPSPATQPARQGYGLERSRYYSWHDHRRLAWETGSPYVTDIDCTEFRKPIKKLGSGKERNNGDPLGHLGPRYVQEHKMAPSSRHRSNKVKFDCGENYLRPFSSDILDLDTGRKQQLTNSDKIEETSTDVDKNADDQPNTTTTEAGAFKPVAPRPRPDAGPTPQSPNGGVVLSSSPERLLQNQLTATLGHVDRRKEHATEASSLLRNLGSFSYG